MGHGQWTEWEAQQSSTWYELKAILNVLQSFAAKFQSERVRWFTDNHNVVRIMLNGIKKPVLQKLALAVFHMCVTYHITVEPELIPREHNEVADYISKIVDYDDWMLHPDVFAHLNHIWGPHTVDRFANKLLTIGRLGVSTLGFGTLKQRLWILLLLIGKIKTIGGIPP